MQLLQPDYRNLKKTETKKLLELLQYLRLASRVFKLVTK